MIPPRSRSFVSPVTSIAAHTVAALAFTTTILKAINPITQPPLTTLVGGHFDSSTVIPFTSPNPVGNPVTTTDDYNPINGFTTGAGPGGSSGGPGSRPWDRPSLVTTGYGSGGGESEGSAPQPGSNQCDCECKACEAAPEIVPLIGGGDSNSTGVNPATMKMIDGSNTTSLGGGLADNMGTVAIRVGGNRASNNRRAQVPMGSLFHLGGDLTTGAIASPVNLRAQYGMGGTLKFASVTISSTTHHFIRQWIGDRCLIDITPVNSSNLSAGYFMKMYTFASFPGTTTEGLFALTNATEFRRVIIEADSGGIQVTESIVTSGPTYTLDKRWVLKRTGTTSPNYTYEALLEKPSGSSWVSVRKHKCELSSVAPPQYVRTVEDYLNSAWTTVFKMKEEWADFTLADGSKRRRITLQERYSNAAATEKASKRVWTYYDADDTDGATYGKAKTMREYGFDSGNIERLVYWEDYGYETTTSYDKIIVHRGLHGSAAADYDNDERIEIQYNTFVPITGYSVNDYPERPVSVYVFHANLVAAHYEVTLTLNDASDLIFTETRYLGPTTSLTWTREYFSTSADNEAKFRPKKFTAPDATFTAWSYALQSSSDPHGLVDTTMERTYIEGGQPQVYYKAERTWTRQGFLIEEVITNPLVSTTLAYTSFAVATSPSLQLDSFGRPLKLVYNGNSADYEEFVFGCCGLESHRKRDGSTTVYMIDKLKRITSKTDRYGTTASLQHTTDYLPGGSASGMIVEQKTGSWLNTRNHYDAAGRIVQVDRLDPDESGDASTTVTHVATSGGLRQTTITHPDSFSSTEVRKNYGDGSPESISGTAVADIKFEYSQALLSGSTTWLEFTAVKTIRLDASAGTAEFSITHRDILDRVRKVDQAKQGGHVTTEYTYNASNQLAAIKGPDPNIVRTLFAYNLRGERTITAIDLNNDNDIDFDTDRVEEHTTDIENATATDSALGMARVDRKYVYLPEASPNDSTRDLVSVNYSAGSGLRTRSESYPTATGTPQIATWTKEITGTGINLNDGDWKETTMRPDGSQTVITHDLWRNATEQETDSSGSTVIATTTRTWQSSGRKLLASVTDARTGETTFSYTDSGHLKTTTLTGPNPDQVTQKAYDSRGRVIQTTQPDSSVTHRKYTAAGLVWKEWGSQAYSVRYGYDEQGRMKTLETFRGNTTNAEPPDSSGSPDVTTWNYDSATGWLLEKVYADSKEVNYTYRDDGRLATRAWARSSQSLVTTYRYTAAGDLLSVDYSDSTPDVLYSYHRTGQLNEVKDGTLASGGISLSTTRSTHSYSWTGLQANQETITGIHNETKVITRKYQTSTNVTNKTVVNRSAGYEVGVAADTDQDFTMTYGYDTAGRISTVANANDTFTYAYVTNAPHLIASMTGPYHSATRTYDPHRDLLATLTNKQIGASTDTSKYTYTVNEIGQRTNIVREGNAFALGSSPSGSHFDQIGYNTSGEVVSSDRFGGNDSGNTGTPVTGFAYDWTYDGIGNRKKYSLNSTNTGYLANNLNEYSKTFNDTDGDGVHDTGESDLSNPVHDDDGNMTQDADYDYTYDAENRLIERTPRTPSSGKLRLKFSYDYLGRRVRIVSDYHNGSAWSNVYYDETILYNGWNPVTHYSWASAAGQTWRKRSYTWGLDLSGTFQGAGGVGGLLSLQGWLFKGETLADTLRYYYTFDGNGNVSEVINYNNGSTYAICAHYEYDAFGNLTRLDNNGGWSIAQINQFRFSTKWHDYAHLSEQTGALSYTMEASKLYYYGYRFYAPQIGRWINRDPSGEQSGLNLMAIVINDLTNDYDILGLSPPGQYDVDKEPFQHHDEISKEQSRYRKNLRQMRISNDDVSCRDGKRHKIIDSIKKSRANAKNMLKNLAQGGDGNLRPGAKGGGTAGLAIALLLTNPNTANAAEAPTRTEEIQGPVGGTCAQSCIYIKITWHTYTSPSDEGGLPSVTKEPAKLEELVLAKTAGVQCPDKENLSKAGWRDISGELLEE